MNPSPRAVRRAAARRRHLVHLERLEDRLALATTAAGLTIGQSLTAVVNNTALGGIQVASVSGFSAGPANLLLTQAGQQAPYGLVSYATAATTPVDAFTLLALTAGDGNQVFKADTIVSQAGQSTSTNGSTVTFAQLSAAGTNSLAVAASSGFTGTGFICILGAASVSGGGGNGIFRYDVSSSTLPTASSAGTFRGLQPVGASGVAANQPFKDIRVPIGSIVIESCSPTPGSTITRTAVTLPPVGQPFKLPIIGGQYGFARPQPGRPGSVIVGLPHPAGATTIVTYTGISPNGLNLTGCTATVTGTISMNASVNATANSPVTFTFTNNASQGLAVYAAIAGQLSDAGGNLTYGYLVPQQTANQNDFTKPLRFVSMASGSPPATVPTFQLFSAASKPGATMSFMVRNSPNARMVSTRVVFGMGLPPVVPIKSNAPSFPAMSNPADQNNRINFDFLEFTMRYIGPNDGTLFVNTTQVDQVGLPFTMNVSPADSSGATNGVGVKIGRSLLASSYASFITTTFTGDDDQSISPAADAAFQGLLTPYRLLNPSDAFTNPPAGYAGVPTLDGYFDAALATFFSNYTGGGFRLQRDGYNFVGTTHAGYQPGAYTYGPSNLGAAVTATPGGTVVVSSAAASGSQITYYAANGFQPGQTVSISGMSPAGFNLANQTIVSASSSSFTIKNALAQQTSTAAGSATALPMLSFPAVAVPGATEPAPISLGAGVLVTGPGITGTAVVAGQPVVSATKVTTVSIAGDVAANSGTYSFTAPGEFTVLQLQQADSSWSPLAGGQTYRLYAPYFASMGGSGGATAFPAGLPVGTGIGSLQLKNGGAGYTPNTVGQLTFTDSPGSNAEGFFVTNNTGTIIAVGLTNPGTGYTSMPTIGFSGAGTPTTPAVVTASALPAAPSWVAPGGPATVQSPGSMTFGCLGVFADGGQQAKAGQVSGTGATGGILSDIENTIVSAFNRGVANSVPVNQDVTTFWETATNFYPKPVAPTAPAVTGANWANYYSAFLHLPAVSVTRPGSQVGLAYGFAYDDQGNNSTTLTSSFPQAVTVQFQPWKSNVATTPLSFIRQPSATGLDVTAQLQGLANKTYRYQLFRVASPASGQWSAVGSPTTTPTGARGQVSVALQAPATGTYVVVAWAADVPANQSPTMTAAAVQFGGQYAASGRFNVTAPPLRLRGLALPAARRPVRWAAVSGR